MNASFISQTHISLLKPGVPRVPNKLRPGLPSPNKQTWQMQCKCVARKVSASEGKGEAKGDGRMESEETTKTIKTNANKTGAVSKKGGDTRG